MDPPTMATVLPDVPPTPNVRPPITTHVFGATELDDSIVVGTEDHRCTELRQAVRAVVVDKANDKIQLLYVRSGKYYKLPGGGVEQGETPEQALIREIKEETGVAGNVKTKIANSEEYRGNLHQFSSCYLVEYTGRVGDPTLTEDEERDGITNFWIPLSEARSLIIDTSPNTVVGQYIKLRDLFFLDKWMELSVDGSASGRGARYLA